MSTDESMRLALQRLIDQVRAGQYDQAIEGLKRFLEQYPQHEVAMGLLGAAYFQIGLPARARECILRAARSAALRAARSSASFKRCWMLHLLRLGVAQSITTSRSLASVPYARLKNLCGRKPMKRLSIAVLCALSSACTYQVTPEGQQALASMTDDQAVQTIKKALTNQEDSGLGMCSLPHFNRDTRAPRFESADTEKFTYLDNKGGGDCTNDCPDPNHQFTVPYAKVKRIFVSRTQTPSTCRSGPGLDVIQIIGWHEKRNFVMVTLPSQDLPRILAAFKHLNPRIALKNAY